MQTLFIGLIKLILYFPQTNQTLKTLGYILTTLTILFSILRIAFGSVSFLCLGALCNIVWVLLVIEAAERGV